MKSNIRFIICPAQPSGYRIIAAYGSQEVVWAGFETVTAAGNRILEACKNLDNQPNDTGKRYERFHQRFP
jgi:hypothetical protein